MFDDFPSFLDALSNSAKRDVFEEAWREFDVRYRPSLLIHLHKMIKREDRVFDAFIELVIKLIDNDCARLKNFRARESELAFRSFLFAIAWTCAMKIIRDDRRTTPLVNEHLLPGRTSVDEDALLPIRLENVERLRKILSNSKKPDDIIERDILVIMLRKFSGFPSKALESMKILNVRHGDVDNIIYKAKDRIGEKDSDLRDFLS